MLNDILASPAFTALALAVAGTVGTLLAAGLTRLWSWIRLHIFHQLNPSEMAFVDSIADKAVRYAYQVVDHAERFDTAAAQLGEQARLRGIPLTDAQIKLWIESALVNFKLTMVTGGSNG